MAKKWSVSATEFAYQTPVLSIEDDPIVTPAEGARYLIGTGTGVWSGKDNQIAWYYQSAWQYVIPTEGFEVTDLETHKKGRFNGSVWDWDVELDDHKVMTSANDTTPGYNEDKVVGTTNKITVTTINEGANEQLQIGLGGHVFDKSADDLDDVTDGSTYAKVRGSALSSGYVAQVGTGATATTDAQVNQAYKSRARFIQALGFIEFDEIEVV